MSEHEKIHLVWQGDILLKVPAIEFQAAEECYNTIRAEMFTKSIPKITQKTREGLWLFPGSVQGFSRRTPGKSQENCWKIFPESRNATNFRISGTGKDKPAGNLGATLPGPCPNLPCGVFLKSTVPAFSSFFFLNYLHLQEINF